MTEEKEEDGPTISQKIGYLLDYNQAVVKSAREQAENWKRIAISYIEMSQAAAEIANDCALFARISVDRTGDVIAAEWDLEVVEETTEENGEETGEGTDV